MTSKTEHKPEKTHPAPGKQLWRATALFVFLVGVFGLALYFVLNPSASDTFDTVLSNWIERTGPLGWLLVIAMMILHSFVPLPAEFVAIAAGLSYGIALGVLLVWIGAMLGAIIAFALARWLGQSFVEQMLKPAHLEKLQKWRNNSGILTLLVSRLIPVISFNLINYAAGLAGVRWWTFLWTTAIGILPMTILSVFIGASMSELPLVWLILFSLTGIMLIFAAYWGYQHWMSADKSPESKNKP